MVNFLYTTMLIYNISYFIFRYHRGSNIYVNAVYVNKFRAIIKGINNDTVSI